MTSQSLWDRLLSAVLPNEDISLSKLEGWVHDLDGYFEQNSFRGVSFEKSIENRLGFTGNKNDFTIFSPWGTWANQGRKNYPSPLQQGVIDAFQQADHAQRADGMSLDCPFVDFASLVPGTEFFTEKSRDESSVAERIAEWSGIMAQGVVTYPFTESHSQICSGLKPMANELRSSRTQRQGYIGYYNPDFHPRSKDTPAIKFIPELAKRVEALIPKSIGLEPISKRTLEDLATFLVNRGIPTVSWNHGKILAINGDVLMTGGANYQKEYQSYWPWNKPDHERRDHEIYDHQAKVLGPAAISAHKWADYFWKYLRDPAETDGNSTWWGSYLNDPDATWYAGHEQRSQTKDDNRTPKIKDPGSGKLPGDVVTCPITGDMRTVSKGKSNVFTCSKLGNWSGPKGEVDYPAQIIEAARDILLNGVYQRSIGPTVAGPDSPGGRIWAANKLLSDDALVSNPIAGWFNVSLRDLNINPTAWASRYTKTWAIAYAQDSVVICQQLLIGTLQSQEPEYKKLVEQVNSGLQLKPEQKWDGHVWPFDLMIAIAQAVGSIWRKHGRNPITDDAKSLRGVYIVLTTSKEGQRQGEGWADETPIARIVHRIATIMRGLPQGDGGGIPPKDVDAAIARHLHFKRVMKDDGQAFSHSKIVCVDRRAMYIGSDNAYPSYNQEHGIWVDDSETINTWLEEFFQPYWAKCTKPDAQSERGFVN